MTTLFHLHFFCQDLFSASSQLRNAGFKLVGAFTRAGESLAVEANLDEICAADLRLLQFYRGNADIVLMPGKFETPTIEHLGWKLIKPETEYLKRAESLGWSHRTNPNRTFIHTPWKFRIELSQGAIDSELDQFTEITIGYKDPEAVAKSLSQLFRVDYQAIDGEAILDFNGCKLYLKSNSELQFLCARFKEQTPCERLVWI